MKKRELIKTAGALALAVGVAGCASMERFASPNDKQYVEAQIRNEIALDVNACKKPADADTAVRNFKIADEIFIKNNYVYGENARHGAAKILALENYKRESLKCASAEISK